MKNQKSFVRMVFYFSRVVQFFLFPHMILLA